MSKRTNEEKRQKAIAKRKSSGIFHPAKSQRRNTAKDFIIPGPFMLPSISRLLNAFIPPPSLSDKWKCVPCDLIWFLQKGLLKTAHCPSCKGPMEAENREARPANVVDAEFEDVTTARIEEPK